MPHCQYGTWPLVFAISLSLGPIGHAAHPIEETLSVTLGPFPCLQSSMLKSTLYSAANNSMGQLSSVDIHRVMPLAVPPDVVVDASNRHLFDCIMAVSTTPSCVAMIRQRYRYNISVQASRPSGVHHVATTASNAASYRSYTVLHASLRRMSELFRREPEAFPSGVTVEYRPVGVSYSGATIGALRIGPPVRTRPRVLHVGLHHAREVMSAEVVCRLAEYSFAALRLGTVAGRDRIVNISRTAELWFVPVLNPDGYEYVLDGHHWWRKNRRSLPDGNVGVDLNRNYPIYVPGISWSSVTAPSNFETYRGPAPFSEPEVAAFRDFVLNDVGDVDVAVSYHSFGPMILYHPGDTETAPPNKAFLQSLVNRLHSLMPARDNSDYIKMQAIEQSPPPGVIYGDAMDWVYHERRDLARIAITYELRPGTCGDVNKCGFYPQSNLINGQAQEQARAALWLAEYVVAHMKTMPSRHGKAASLRTGGIAADSGPPTYSWASSSFSPTLVAAPTYFPQSEADIMSELAASAQEPINTSPFDLPNEPSDSSSSRSDASVSIALGILIPLCMLACVCGWFLLVVCYRRHLKRNAPLRDLQHGRQVPMSAQLDESTTSECPIVFPTSTDCHTADMRINDDDNQENVQLQGEYGSNFTTDRGFGGGSSCSMQPA